MALSRYRITRPAFDVVSVFGSLWAKKVPGPVFVKVLGERGYGPSAVRNQIVRMAARDALFVEKEGRYSIIALAPHLEANFLHLSAGQESPEYDGELSLVLYDIPEADRSVRDRLLYIAGHHGYGKLRSGALVCVQDRSDEVLPFVELPPGAWAIATHLRPDSVSDAQDLIERAYGVRDTLTQIEKLSRQLSAMESAFRTTKNVSHNQFYDVFFDAAMIGFQLPTIPPELTRQKHPAVEQARLMDRIMQFHAVALKQREVEIAMQASGVEHIEFR